MSAGSLQIRRSVESDEGKYECVAENSVGLTISYAANLYVRGTTNLQLSVRLSICLSHIFLSLCVSDLQVSVAEWLARLTAV